MSDTPQPPAAPPPIRHWLKSLCDPDSRRVRARRPFVLTLDGRPVTVATDERLLVAVDGLLPDCPAADAIPEDGRAVARLLTEAASAPPSGRVTLAALRDWCGPREADKGRGCGNCGGDGRCVCRDCEADHSCNVCDGTGTVYEAVVRPGRVAAFDRHGHAAVMTIDRNRLALVLPHLPGGDGDAVAVTAADNLLLAGPGWRVLMSPMMAEFREGMETGPQLSLEPMGG